MLNWRAFRDLRQAGLVPKPPSVRLLCESRMQEVLRNHSNILDVGSGGRRLVPTAIGLDIGEHKTLDVRADACYLPFRDATFDLCVCTSVLEHIPDPTTAVAEIGRVTRDEGCLWLEVPFLYHYHTGGDADTHDYTRWTREGVRRLVALAGFEILEMGTNVGPGTALRLMAAETVALLFWQRNHSALYHLSLSVVGWALVWLSWLDTRLVRTAPEHRVSGGFYVYARKRLAGRHLEADA